MRTVIILLAIVAVLLIIRVLYRQSSPDLKKIGLWLATALGGGLLLFLLATGRLHWLFALGAAALPVFYRLLPLIRYVPLLRNIYRRYQARQAGTTGAAASGQTSTVQSRFLRMTLNHDTGEMNGEVLEGQFKGLSLKQLNLEQLCSLLQDYRQEQDSLSLLMAYLERVHPEWREQAGNYESAYNNKESYDITNQKISEDEAYEILGLESGASKQEIKSAHRRLMQKLHPDHGGSTYLAAKINLAKDVLLKKV